MQDRPTALELIQAISGFLENEIVPVTVDTRLRFRMLIAIHVLGVVSRELAAGTVPLQSEWSKLAAILGSVVDVPNNTPENDARLRTEIQAFTSQLCTMIRNGECDTGESFEAVLMLVEATVIDKLKIANPRYLKQVAQ